VIHVVEHLVLADHAPDERVCLRADAGVDRPARADHGLFVAHDDVAGLVRPTAQVKHRRIGGKRKIEVDLHPALVGVRRERVPDAAGLEHGHPHRQLARFDDTRDEQLVDRASR